MVDKALSFDGSNDMVSVAEAISLDMTGNMSLEAWVKLNDYSKYYFLVCKQPSGTAGNNYPGNYEWRIEITTGKQQFLHQTSTGETFSSYSSNSPIGVGAFHYIAIVVNVGNNVNFYLDGVPDGSLVQSTAFGIINNEPVRIGTRKDMYSYLLGVKDEIRISNIVRSSEEILANWNNGYGKKLEVDANTVALWHMDEGEGGTIFDETENNNDGTIEGASWVDGFPFPLAYYHGLKVQGVGELALCDVGTHPLRIRKGGTTYGIELVATDDPNASALRIKTGAGIKAIRKYT